MRHMYRFQLNQNVFANCNMILVKNAATRSSPFAAFSNITQYFHLCKYFLRQQRLVDIALADAAVLCHQLHRFLPADPLLLIDFHMLLERQVLPVLLLFLLQFLKCLLLSHLRLSLLNEPDNLSDALHTTMFLPVQFLFHHSFFYRTPLMAIPVS